MKKRAVVFLFAVTVLTALLCVSVGSVRVPLSDILALAADALSGRAPTGASRSIILDLRLPRVLCTALTGACLSLSGAAMQGLLKNPLADGSTLGVASGASLGAVISIAFGFNVFGGTAMTAVVFAFASLLLILALASGIDSSLSTDTIILIGVIFSMFVSGAMSVIVTVAPDRLRSITFWTMGSLSGCGYGDALLLLTALLLCGGVLLSCSDGLNAFSIGEENARQIGVNVKAVRLKVLICASALIGVSVSVAGCIGFVGLVTPHIVRLLVGANNKRLLPGSVFGGGIFLMLCDLAGRTVAAPREIPIGVITSMIGAVIFIVIFCRSRRGRA
ncbi:MAG: iron ABC transporter permease [Eubacteriales bacterium]|nr:iron ABC transporter permease [Eubacteriales bacterium]